MQRSLIFLGSRDERDRATRVGVARILVGASTFQPVAISRHLVGLPEDQATGPFIFFARAFGVRNMVLGAWVLAARDRPKQYRRLCYQVNAAVDAVDLAALLLATVQRRMPKRFVALTTVLATNACMAFLQLASEV
ncbi:MAG: hypothetical protein JOY80_11695 [Candidatus Dormibacteraeota bacterium]|nr:hypothetical protein [Candidatus Dormibacteraeota bacterium]